MQVPTNIYISLKSCQKAFALLRRDKSSVEQTAPAILWSIQDCVPPGWIYATQGSVCDVCRLILRRSACCWNSLVSLLWTYLLTKSRPTLCSPEDCSTSGLPGLHCVQEPAQTHGHWISIAIQPSHPLSPPSPALNLSKHQGLFQWVGSLHQEAKVLELQLQHQTFQRIFRVDFLYDWLVGSPCSLRDSEESSPALQFESIRSASLSLLYGPTLTFIHDYWKSHSFDYMHPCWLLLNALSRFVIASSQKQASFDFVAAVTICLII